MAPEEKGRLGPERLVQVIVVVVDPRGVSALIPLCAHPLVYHGCLNALCGCAIHIIAAADGSFPGARIPLCPGS